MRRILLVATANPAKANSKYITTGIRNASCEIAYFQNHEPEEVLVIRNGVTNPSHPPVLPKIIIAIKSGLAMKMGKGQQTGTVKQKNKMRFIAEDIELRLKHELKKTPREEMSSALLTTSNIKDIKAKGCM